jgi:hypothetical protein
MTSLAQPYLPDATPNELPGCSGRQMSMHHLVLIGKEQSDSGTSSLDFKD